MLRIEAVENELSLWRSKRTKKNEKIPEFIRSQIIALRAQYSDKEISRRLNIRKNQIVSNFAVQSKKKKNSDLSVSKSSPAGVTVDRWVETSLGSLSSSREIKMKLSNPKGHHLELTLQSLDEVTPLFRFFMSHSLEKL